MKILNLILKAKYRNEIGQLKECDSANSTKIYKKNKTNQILSLQRIKIKNLSVYMIETTPEKYKLTENVDKDQTSNQKDCQLHRELKL